MGRSSDPWRYTAQDLLAVRSSSVNVAAPAALALLGDPGVLAMLDAFSVDAPDGRADG